MKRILFILITLIVNANTPIVSQSKIPTKVIILTGKGQLTSESVEVRQNWCSSLTAKFHEPFESGIIKILNSEGVITYEQDIDAKIDDYVFIELPNAVPGKYSIEVISTKGMLTGEFDITP